MKNEIKETYETGATSHAVNDLILFTDNTPELVDLRDNIYQLIVEQNFPPIPTRFYNLLGAAKKAYIQQFPNIEDHQHIRGLFTKEQGMEFMQIYLDDLDNWKKEHF